MNMRKIGVVGSFAAGTALALAPLASAETSFDFSDVTQGEISSMNFLFESQAALAGVDSADIIKSTGGFDTIDSDNVNATFASLLYGFNPDNVASDPGSYALFNGATTQFNDAFNVVLYAALNNGDLIDAGNLIGSSTAIDAVLADADGSVMGAFGSFFETGVSDVAGYLDVTSLFS